MRVGWLLAGGLAAALAATAQTAPAPVDVVGEVGAIVGEHFYDAERLAEVGWEGLVAAARVEVGEGVSAGEVRGAIDALLAALGASHTARYTVEDAEYHQLVALFRPALEEEHPELYRTPPGYDGVGVLSEDVGGATFVRTVLAGTPAAAAGVLVGDELVAVDGEPWRGVASFAGRAGETVTLAVRRRRGEAPIELAVVPARLDAATMFLDAERAGARVVDVGGVAVGVVPLPSYAGQPVQDLLVELTLDGPLRDAAALVLDLRGGWGGADPAYLSFFDPRVPTLTYVGRDGAARAVPRTWTRPVVLLVDERTRSGKEVLAHAFRRHGVGPVVGGTTAGAVLGGRPFVLSDGSVLYLAVLDVRVDGERLEGIGVAPDVPVPFDLPYAAGADPRLEKALQVAAGLVSRALSPPV